MENNFLAINKEYFKAGLKSIDILIIAQIEEFERNGCKCYMTNKQFSEMFGESESTVKRALDKLEDMKIIKRTTTTNNEGSNKSRIRTLSVNKAGLSKVQNEPKQGSNIDEARFKNEISKVHNEPIKDNIKDNIKENEEDKLTLINNFYEEEKERLGEEVRFIETEEGIRSYLGDKCMGNLILTEE